MKEKKQPILSICIPTWNRWYALQHTLKSIIDQDDFKSWNVEIIISDNASTDETEIEIKKLCQRYRNIRYFRNEKWIKSNANINKVISLWEWEYLRLLGSDSIIINDWIKETIKIIKSKKPDIIYYNREQDHKVYFNKELEEYDRDNNLYSFKSQNAFLEFLWNLHKYDKRNFRYAEKNFTFISVRCISKNFYNSIIHKIYLKFKNIDSNSFSQTIIFYFEDVRNYIVAFTKPHIERYHTNKAWYFVSLKILKDLFNLYYFIKKKYDGLSFIIVFKSISLWILRFLYWLFYRFLQIFWLEKCFKVFMLKIFKKYR